MKVGGCYNVTGLPEYSSEIGFRVDRERREEQLLWAENIWAKHFPLADYSTLQNSQDEHNYIISNIIKFGRKQIMIKGL